VKRKDTLYEDCHRVIMEDCSVVAATPIEEGTTGAGHGTEEVEEHDTDEGEDQVAPLPAQFCRGSGPRSTVDPQHVVLLIDTSGSMRTLDVVVHSAGEEVVSRLEAATLCASQFAQAHFKRNPCDRFSLATFGDTASILGEAMAVAETHEALRNIGMRGMGGTSFLAALTAVANLVVSQPTLQSHVVVLSDGRPADTKAALKLFQAQFLHGNCAGTRIHGIGFGATVQSFAPLQQLACLSGGSFVLSTCSIAGLDQAFSSVSSTITTMSSGCFNEHGQGALKRTPCAVTFEPPEIGDFGRRDVLRFHAERNTFHYDGENFHKESHAATEVARRLHPCMRGGMRLVYGFCDPSVTKGDGSWMVARLHVILMSFAIHVQLWNHMPNPLQLRNTMPRDSMQN
jgi:uncharacterized protein YegL